MIVFLFINQAILLLGQCTRLGTWKGNSHPDHKTNQPTNQPTDRPNERTNKQTNKQTNKKKHKLQLAEFITPIERKCAFFFCQVFFVNEDIT